MRDVAAVNRVDRPRARRQMNSRFGAAHSVAPSFVCFAHALITTQNAAATASAARRTGRGLQRRTLEPLLVP